MLESVVAYMSFGIYKDVRSVLTPGGTQCPATEHPSFGAVRGRYPATGG